MECKLVCKHYDAIMTHVLPPLVAYLKVTGYREWAWFKNNCAKEFFACNYYVSVHASLCYNIATTSNAVFQESMKHM